jgi:hypothetical protein
MQMLMEMLDVTCLCFIAMLILSNDKLTNAFLILFFVSSSGDLTSPTRTADPSFDSTSSSHTGSSPVQPLAIPGIEMDEKFELDDPETLLSIGVVDGRKMLSTAVFHTVDEMTGDCLSVSKREISTPQGYMVRTNKLLVFFMEIFQVLKMDINIKIICTSIIIHCTMHYKNETSIRNYQKVVEIFSTVC